MKKTLAKVLRVTTIVLMGLTAAITVLSGIGTTCVAWGAENYGERMAALIPYKSLYQMFVVLTLGIGVAVAAETFGLVRGTRWAYAAGLITLVIGLIVGGAHMYASRMLRGSSMPADIRVYLSGLTLVVLLIMRLPGIWSHIAPPGSSSREDTRIAPAGITLVVIGLAIITTSMWAGPSHLLDGYNWVNVLRIPLTLSGSVAVAAGTGLLVASASELRATVFQSDVTCAADCQKQAPLLRNNKAC